ncbi:MULTISPECIES: BTAD domain-containing putative transcriptional regulator [unclassified Micromonospora]|uniref:AfsR/SARP family transcriptional regulator n=1 Tax=unclassified Micromonospora TaxID=2617518 RepID=UPI003A84AB7F
MQVLGPVRVWREQQALDPGPTARRAVLGLLALAGGQPLPRWELVDALWPDQPPPATSTNVIQTHVKHLRRLFEPDRPSRAPSLLLPQIGDGYLLRTSAVTVDLLRFRHLVATARPGAAGLERDAELLGEALQLWQGPPLVDVPTLAGHPKVVALDGELQAALTRYGDLMIACGRASAALPWLTQAAAAKPLDEARQAQLIRAYRASGQRAEAFTVFHDTRDRLADELGVDPGPELVAAYTDLLRADAPAGARTASEQVWPRRGRRLDANRPVPAQLPADVAGFTGRAAELGWLDRTMGAAGRGDAEPGAVICVLSGSAGVGKTALAVWWARRARDRFPDGQLYIDLRGYDPEQPVEPGTALARFLRALGVADADMALDVDERAAHYRSLMDGRRMLVVLDNAASVEQVRPLLPGAASCPVLVTSRDPLAGLVAREGAGRRGLGLLPIDDAVALLRRLVGDRVDAEPQAAVTLATQCAQLPLALRVAAELATARAELSLTRLVDGLTDRRRRLDMLDAGGDRRTGVRAILSWSYQYLPAEAARAFRLLGLHPGADVDAAAVAALAGTDPVTADRLVNRLCRAHLVEPAGPDRYGMHDLLRAYAAELAADVDPPEVRDAAVTRLFDYYLRTAATAMDAVHPAERHLRPTVPPTGPDDGPTTAWAEPAAWTAPASGLAGGAPGAARVWLEVERANLMAVTAYGARHGRARHAVRLTALLYRHLECGGHYPDAITMQGHGIAAARAAADLAGEANLLTNLAVVHDHQGRRQQAVAHLRQALTLYRDVDEPAGEARTLGNLGVVLGELGDRRSAICYIGRALALLRTLGEHHGVVRALGSLGQLFTVEGRLGDAAGQLREGLVLCRRTGDRVGEAMLLNYAGQLHNRRGADRAAARCHALARSIAADTGSRGVEALAFDGLGAAAHAAGQRAQAHGYWRRALAIFTELGAPEAAAISVRLSAEPPRSSAVIRDHAPRFGRVP